MSPSEVLTSAKELKEAFANERYMIMSVMNTEKEMIVHVVCATYVSPLSGEQQIRLIAELIPPSDIDNYRPLTTKDINVTCH